MGHAANAETKIENLRNSPQLVKSLEVAFQLAPGLGHDEIQPAHLALALLEDPDVLFLINAYGVDMEQTKSNILKQLPPVTKATSQNAQLARKCAFIIEHAAHSASSSAQDELDSTMVFAALLSDKESQLAKLLYEEDLTVETVEEYIELRSGQVFKMPVLPPMPKQAATKPEVKQPKPEPAPSPQSAQKPEPAKVQQAANINQQNDTAPVTPKPVTTKPAPAVSQPVAARPVTEGQAAPTPVATAKAANPVSPNSVSPSRVPPAAAAPHPATPAKPVAMSTPTPNNTTPNSAPAPAPVQKNPAAAPLVQAAPPSQKPTQKTVMDKEEAQNRAQSILQSTANTSSSDYLTQKITNATRAKPTAVVENSRPLSNGSADRGTLSATKSVIEKGRLNVDFPGIMRVGESEIVKINLQRNKDEAEDPLQDPVVTEALTVQLKAPAGNFHIEPLRPETNWLDPKTRYIGDGAYGNWKWKVRPLKSGQTQLNLVVSARTLDESGLLSEAVLPDQTISIRVQANYMRWVYLAGIGLFATGSVFLLTQFYPLIRTFF